MTETRPPLACLIGWPAAHSRSPLIHRYWLRTLGIEGGYVIEAVPPEDFRDFVLRLSPRGFVGANVTRPHKEHALALSKPDARANAVQLGATGTELLVGARQHAKAADAAILDALTKSKRKAFIAALEKLSHVSEEAAAKAARKAEREAKRKARAEQKAKAQAARTRGKGQRKRKSKTREKAAVADKPPRAPPV